MTKRSQASKNKQRDLGKAPVKKTVDSAGKKQLPVGYQSVTRAGISHFISVLPLIGAKGISIPDVVKKMQTDIAKGPKWKQPSGFPSDMSLAEYQSSLNVVYNWLVQNTPDKIIPEAVDDYMFGRLVAETGLQLRPVVIAQLCRTAAIMIHKEVQAAKGAPTDTSTTRMQAHIHRWLDIVLDDDFAYTHPVSGETRRFGHHRWPMLVDNSVSALDVMAATIGMGEPSDRL